MVPPIKSGISSPVRRWTESDVDIPVCSSSASGPAAVAGHLSAPSRVAQRSSWPTPPSEAPATHPKSCPVPCPQPPASVSAQTAPFPAPSAKLLKNRPHRGLRPNNLWKDKDKLHLDLSALFNTVVRRSLAERESPDHLSPAHGGEQLVRHGRGVVFDDVRGAQALDEVEDAPPAMMTTRYEAGHGEDAVADAKARYAFTYGDDAIAEELLEPVDMVDAYGRVADDELPGSGGV
ncbi:hypothetical protein CNMCM5623_009651 [Aspergillus felis]|uniref:Uncharacterized protein n=1 Tax=Aspergillus felis TaxID=1287682 RepID=A0A8H6PLC0_9EURO|nr:hypothetical protein CNMCM5623_009651 [Aspergillus felis]